jgi:DNA-binding protein Fis
MPRFTRNTLREDVNVPIPQSKGMLDGCDAGALYDAESAQVEKGLLRLRYSPSSFP